jgi:hypothetical protein
MKRIAIAALLWSGCATNHDSRGIIHSQPSACATTASVVGAAGVDAQVALGPYMLDDNGVAVCLQLDTRQMSRAEFAASTDRHGGDTSGFAAQLESSNGTTILDGWDVSYGDAPPETFLDLEWGGVAVGAVTDAVIWVYATDSAESTTLSLELLDPLE